MKPAFIPVPSAAAAARGLPRGASVPRVRRAGRALALSLWDAEPQGVVALALSLAAGDWRQLACELLNEHPAAKDSLRARQIRALARGIQGWAPVDQLGCFITGPAWREGQIHESLIHQWAHSPDRWLRRLAVVSTVPLNSKARGGSGDAARTLEICRGVVQDRDDMVVKALSWALRELSKRDRAAVERFLKEQGEHLAPRVRHKLATGLKNPSRRAKPATARRMARAHHQ